MKHATISYDVLQDNSILLASETGEQRIQAVTDRIIRVTAPVEAAHRRPEATEGFESEQIPLRVEETEDGLFLQTSCVHVQVYADGRLDFLTPQGIPLCRDYAGSIQRAEALSVQERELAALEGHTMEDTEEHGAWRMAKAMDGDECFYGLGDKTGFLNKRGYRYVMWNTDNPHTHLETRDFRALYKSIPFLIVLKEQGVFGLFWDNAHKMIIDLACDDERCYRMEADAGSLDYYYIAGDTLAEVVEGYTSLTGRTPLLPLWTLGYHQSRWSYASADEVREIAHRLREYDLPCDAIHLDIDYMEGYKVFTWNKERFCDVDGLLAELQECGFKLVTIVDPGVKKELGYSVYDEGLQNDYFLRDADDTVYENIVWPGTAVFPDFSDPAVRRWWQELVSGWIKQGIAGIWNDMNEPASFNGPLPDDLRFDNEGEPATHADMHNLYGHLMAKATAEAFAENGQRPYVITRACYSGSQKYTTAWTGDNQSVWAHLQMSIPQLCNLGLSGMPMVGCDVGGFGQNATPELMARWVEAGWLTPFFRNHCASGCRRQEPWAFGNEVLCIYRHYLKWRYRFLPYLYDRLWEATETGLPIMRPLVLHYADDPHTYDLNDEFLVGETLLVAPVVEQGKRVKMVYLPQGGWIDYWTGERQEGGRYLLRDAPLDTCPLYVKENSILPLYPEGMTHVEDRPPEELTLVLYGQSGKYRHYQDAGQGLCYREGAYNLYHIAWAGDRLTISLEHAGFPPYQRFVIQKEDRTWSVETQTFPYTLPL